MFIIAEKYTSNVERVRLEINKQNKNCKICVLESNGFLPENIYSPSEYIVTEQEEKKLEIKDLFFDFVEVPEFYEIKNEEYHGAVYNMGKKVAAIYFRWPLEKRNVDRVEWCTEDGWIFKKDYYCKYGIKYASEFLSADGVVESKVFYSSKHQEIIAVHPQNEVVSLYKDRKTEEYFTDYQSYVEYALDKMGLSGDCMLIAEDEAQLEKIKKIQLKNISVKNVLFLENQLLDKYKQMGGTDGILFYELTTNYRENYARGEALILTDSDQLMAIERIVKALPEMNIHIAAATQVSDKLEMLANNENVAVYPQISTEKLNELWDNCDFYLDINHLRELNNAISQAQKHNLLLLGFEATIHNSNLILQECIYKDYEADLLIDNIKNLIGKKERIDILLKKQQEQYMLECEKISWE